MKTILTGLAILLSAALPKPESLEPPEFWKRPLLYPRGPEVRVEVRLSPFEIKVEGDARLLDYTHQLAERAHQTGNPIVHPLVFDWPDDPRGTDLWEEYMYGPALLVAPIWRLGQRI